MPMVKLLAAQLFWIRMFCPEVGSCGPTDVCMIYEIPKCVDPTYVHIMYVSSTCSGSSAVQTVCVLYMQRPTT